MEVGDQFSKYNCSNATKLKMANFFDVGTSVACLIILMFFIAFLVLYKAYKTILQRLLFYLTIATALDAMIVILNIELQFNTDPKSKFCTYIGFYDAWTSIVIRLFSLAFTLQLSTTVYQTFKGRKLKCLKSCQRRPVLTEVVCILAIILIPLSFLWVPAQHHNYGFRSTHCFTKLFDEHCNHTSHSKSDAIMYEAVDIALHLIVTISFSALAIIILMNIIKIRYSRKVRVVSVGRNIFLIAVVGITLCIRTTEVGFSLSQYYKETTITYVYIFGNPLYAITNLMILIGFAVYLYSPKKLKIKSLQKAAKQWLCCKRINIQPGRIRQNDKEGSVSVNPSEREEAPSETQSISPCPTNQLTQITENVSFSVPKYQAILNVPRCP